MSLCPKESTRLTTAGTLRSQELELNQQGPLAWSTSVKEASLFFCANKGQAPPSANGEPPRLWDFRKCNQRVAPR
eukprot:3114714-Amphidinium_carterae.1